MLRLVVFMRTTRAMNPEHGLQASPLKTYMALALRHPALVPAMVRAAWRFRARFWWRRPPFLPLPPRSYLAWRDHTAYGDEAVHATSDELKRYLRWTERMKS